MRKSLPMLYMDGFKTAEAMSVRCKEAGNVIDHGDDCSPIRIWARAGLTRSPFKHERSQPFSIRLITTKRLRISGSRGLHPRTGSSEVRHCMARNHMAIVRRRGSIQEVAHAGNDCACIGEVIFTLE